MFNINISKRRKRVIFKKIYLNLFYFVFILLSLFVPQKILAQTTVNIAHHYGTYLCPSNEIYMGSYLETSWGYIKCAQVYVNGERAVTKNEKYESSAMCPNGKFLMGLGKYYATGCPPCLSQTSYPRICDYSPQRPCRTPSGTLGYTCPPCLDRPGSPVTTCISPCGKIGNLCANLGTSKGNFEWGNDTIEGGGGKYFWELTPTGYCCRIGSRWDPNPNVINIESASPLRMPIGVASGGILENLVFGCDNNGCWCPWTRHDYSCGGVYYTSTKPPLPPPPTVSLTAPSRISYGDTATLHWVTGGNPTSIWSNFLAYLPSGYLYPRPTYSLPYSVGVSNAGGQASASRYVLVCPRPLTASVTRMCSNEKPLNRITWSSPSGARYYRIMRNGSYITDYLTGTSFDDKNTNPNISYSYRVDAYPADKTCFTESNTVSTTSHYCVPPRITNFSALPQWLLRGEESTLNFSASNVTGVTISNAGYSWSNATPTNLADTKPLGPLTETTTYTMTATNPCPAPYCYPDKRNLTVYVSTGEMEGGGDVFSGKDLSDPSGKIRFDTKSVLSAAGVVDVPGIPDVPGSPPKVIWKIPSYETVMWSINQKKVNEMITKIKKSATTAAIGSNYSGNWILDNDSTSPGVPLGQTTNYPKVWVKTGDLTLGDVTFSGRGTIIVEGNLTINGSSRYLRNTDFVGIIANNITITNNVNSLVGAYYASGVPDAYNGTIEMLAK